MSQWNNLVWTEAHCIPGGIVIKPKNGKVHASHAVHPWDALDWTSENAKKEGGTHLHKGDVDHILLTCERRNAVVTEEDGTRRTVAAVAVHATWRDKSGNILRQDCHFQGI